MGNELAILGGPAVRAKAIPNHHVIDERDKQAILRVLDSGYLSLFEGNFQPDPPFSFRGGPAVQKLELEWAEYYGAKHAIAVNSATSGLYAAVGAAGVGPGHEVVVSPYSMTASATCAVVYNALPVFVDVSADNFNLDPIRIQEAITPRTKAIVVVHQFGHPADMDPIMDLARKHGLKVIEDCAQAHGALYKGRPVGSLGDMGVFSLNVNKTIQTGEGGIIVTNDDDLAERLCLIRNHGEAVVERMGRQDITNIVGWNYRMGEMEAAMASVQLGKLEELNHRRIELADYLTEQLSEFDGITPPAVRSGCRHTYYLYVLKFDERTVGVSRKTFVKALSAEGTPFYEAYMRPLYLQPMYQNRTAFGGCPFDCPKYTGEVIYDKGICPTVERLSETEVFLTEMCHYPLTTEDMDDITRAFQKVFDNLDKLRNLQHEIDAQVTNAYVAADPIK